MSDHDRLTAARKALPEDYCPWGDVIRWESDRADPDCSWGCKHYFPLRGHLGMDWGVCTNPNSHRCGLLTFEHQGCQHFERSGVTGAAARGGAS